MELLRKMYKTRRSSPHVEMASILILHVCQFLFHLILFPLSLSHLDSPACYFDVTPVPKVFPDAILGSLNP